MVQNVVPNFLKAFNRGVAYLTTGTSSVTLYTGGANGSKITSILASQTSTSALDLTVAIKAGGVAYSMWTILVPVSAGAIGSVPMVSLMPSTPPTAIDSDGNPFLFLASSTDTLTVTSAATVPTATATVDLTCFGADF